MTNRMRFITDIAMMTAVAIVLSFLKFKAPWAFGGSVSLAMLPIVLMAFRHGVKGGLLTGLLYGIIDFLISPFFIHPIQVLLDYPIAFMVVGFAGLVHLNPQRGKFSQASVLVVGTLIGSFFRFVCHCISAAVWFGQYAPEGMPVWLYSAAYNASYIVPSFALVAFVLVLLTVDAPRLLRPNTAAKVKVDRS